MARIKRELGCYVMLVHHTGKDAERGARGSTAFIGAVDNMIRVKRAEGESVGEIYFEKVRGEEGQFSVWYTLEKIKLGMDKKLRYVRTAVAVPAKAPVKKGKLGTVEKEVYDFLFAQVAGDATLEVDPHDVALRFGAGRTDRYRNKSRVTPLLKALLAKNWITGSINDATSAIRIATGTVSS
jgi:hypothetical protein